MQQQINNIFERGTLYCIGIGGLAFWLGKFDPLFGKTMMGLILGIMLRSLLFNKKSEKRITFCAIRLLLSGLSCLWVFESPLNYKHWAFVCFF